VATVGDALVTETSYNNRGLVDTTVAPDGTITKAIYDDLSHQIAIIENFGNADVTLAGVVTGLETNEPDTDRVTRFEFDGLGNTTKRIAHYVDESGTIATQETAYVYGVSTSSVPLNSEFNSNDLLVSIHYPNETSGVADTAAAYSVYMAYNIQGELIAMEDQNGSRHEYELDGLGRVIMDEVTQFASFAVDDTIDRIKFAFDDYGRPVSTSSIFKGMGDEIANQMEYEYDTLGNLVTLKQNPIGEVDASTSTGTVEYEYDIEEASFGSAVSNYSRLKWLRYPMGTDRKSVV